jgi:hypothetical protein
LVKVIEEEHFKLTTGLSRYYVFDHFFGYLHTNKVQNFSE